MLYWVAINNAKCGLQVQLGIIRPKARPIQLKQSIMYWKKLAEDLPTESLESNIGELIRKTLRRSHLSLYEEQVVAEDWEIEEGMEEQASGLFQFLGLDAEPSRSEYGEETDDDPTPPSWLATGKVLLTCICLLWFHCFDLLPCNSLCLHCFLGFHSLHLANLVLHLEHFLFVHEL